MPKQPQREKKPPEPVPVVPLPAPQRGTGANPPWLEHLFQIGMFTVGIALVGLFIFTEMKGHVHGVAAWIGHGLNLGFSALFMLVAFRGLTRTAAFAKGLATAWRTKGGG